jgi:hypothetical protein
MPGRSPGSNSARPAYRGGGDCIGVIIKPACFMPRLSVHYSNDISVLDNVAQIE